jgi:CRP-like cAMP-binding protein
VLWDRLSPADRAVLSRHAEQLDARAGSELVAQGETADAFFVIRAGTARVVRDGREIGRLGPGEFFGELALLETDRRPASVIAETDVRLLVLAPRDFARLLAALPRVAAHLRAVAWRRLLDLA